MPTFKIRLNLAAKFNLLTISMIILSSVVICLFLIRSESKHHHQDLLNHGKTIASSTAQSCEKGISSEDASYFQQVFDGLASDPDIAYVAIVSRDKRVLASRAFMTMAMLPDNPAAATDDAGESVVSHDVVGSNDGERFVEIVAPVFASGAGGRAGVVGHLRLGLSQQGSNTVIRRFVASVSLVISLIVLIGGALTVIVTRRITTPLKRLTAATQDVSEGKFDFPIEIRSNDELSDLAASFNTMRDRLRLYHVQVSERTSELTTTNEKLRGEITARESAEDRLQHDALHDSLTGLPNRGLFMERLSHVMTMSQRRKDFSYAVLFVDLDRFKVINDSLGHICGDLLLIALGHRLVTCLRPHDTVARLGGDEFAILLEDTMGMGNATYIAERIGAAMVAPFTFAKREVFATASIGIALSARGYQRPDEVLRDAHTAMYQAKSGGRAQYVVFEPGMHAHAVERLRLETDLRRAVERNEFTVFYQPVVSLATNRIVGFEALARWQHPDRGLVEPGEFVHMAEETGLIVSIDRLVIREACRQMQEWLTQRPHKGLAFISANISNKQMTQPDLVEFVSRTLKETGLRPERLKLEITENVIIENPEEAVAILHRLKTMGVRLYIDDFGTGYSSLSYLHLLPIDGLKIDRSFIERMGDHGENLEIVKTIMLLGRDMNIDVIAEGLETASQLAQIKSLNCEYGQGFLFSKPVDGARALALFEKEEATRA